MQVVRRPFDGNGEGRRRGVRSAAAASSRPSVLIAAASSLLSTVESRRPWTASGLPRWHPRPAGWPRRAALSRRSGWSGSKCDAVWNRSSSPWKLWSSVSCRSRAIRVRSLTRAFSVSANS